MERKDFQLHEKCSLNQLLSNEGFSRSQISKLYKLRDVRVNGNKTGENCELSRGDTVTVFFKEGTLKTLDIQKIYEDDNIIVVNKPQGIEVEGESGIASRLKGKAVHRLDRNTSGLMILAKNLKSYRVLSEVIKNKGVTKKYLAEVVGETNFQNYLFECYLLKDEDKAEVKVFTKAVKGSKKCQTIFNTISSNPSSSIVECELLTGRTHQIRASLAYLGHAIIGDGKYGRGEDNKKFNVKLQHLHSYYLKFGFMPSHLNYLSGKTFVCYPTWVKK